MLTLKLEFQSKMPLNILLPVDDSDCTRATLKWVTQFLDKHRVRLHILNSMALSMEPSLADALRLEKAEEVLAESKYYLDEQGFTVEQAEITYGATGRAITDYAYKQGIDLIILSSHDRHGLAKFFMGSVGSDVFHEANRPALVLSHMHGGTIQVSHVDQVELVAL